MECPAHVGVLAKEDRAAQGRNQKPISRDPVADYKSLQAEIGTPSPRSAAHAARDSEGRSLDPLRFAPFDVAQGRRAESTR